MLQDTLFQLSRLRQYTRHIQCKAVSVTHRFVSFVSILTNRLVLNLKKAGNLHMQHEAPTLPSLAFATESLVGNLGASFRVSDEDDELQDQSNNDHELRERNGAGQDLLILENA